MGQAEVRLEIVKCHGSGNDFPLIDARPWELDDAQWTRVARALADRSGPVGGDGLLILSKSLKNNDFSMRMFNVDGSEAETCLNGLRCVARMGFETLGLDRATVQLKTSTAAVERDAPLAEGVVTIRETAGPASLRIADWPMYDIPGETIVEAPVPPLDSRRLFTAVAMPNPHLVTFVDTLDEAELVAVGEACEAAPAWLPHRANVSFVEVRSSDADSDPNSGSGQALYVRTFERGVGLTDSCGSAMAASSFAACLTGRLRYGAPITVFNRGGLVRASVGEDAMVQLSGNATWEWAGSIEVDPDTGRTGDLVVHQRFHDEIAAWSRVADAASR